MKQLVILFLSLVFLAACGIKPGGVEPPEGPGTSGFPHTYPDPSTDPHP